MLRDLLAIAESGDLVSIAFLGEMPGRSAPIQGLAGRYERDPYRVIGELTVLKRKLTDRAVERDFADSLQ